MNTSTQWLYRQHEAAPPPGEHRCYLCGASCEQTYSVARGIADTFNSHYLALCPSSLYLCQACQWYFDSKAAHPDFRKMSVIVTERSWRNWQRAAMKADISRWLTCRLEADALLVVSLSKKKHILLQAPLNAAGSRQLAIQVEEQVAHVEQKAWRTIEHPFLTLLALGHLKGEILSGNLYGATLCKHGHIQEALRLSRQLDPWRRSALLDLYSYITIIEEDPHAGYGGPRGAAATERAGSADATPSECSATLAGDLEIDLSVL